MHKRHSSCPVSLNEDAKQQLPEKSKLGQEGKKKMDKLHQVKKMHSFNRQFKNCNEYKNPDAQEKKPSYMRQTCASLVKRNTFKARSISELPGAISSTKKPPRFTLKRILNKTKTDGKSSSPEQTSNHQSTHSDEPEHQDDDSSVQTLSEQEFSETESTISETESSPSSTPIEQDLENPVQDPETAKIVSDFVSECFRNIIIEVGTEKEDLSEDGSHSNKASTQKTNLADVSETWDSDLSAFSIDSEDKGNEDNDDHTFEENPVTNGDLEGSESPLMRSFQARPRGLDNIRDPSPFHSVQNQTKDDVLLMEEDFHQRDPPGGLQSHKLDDSQLVSSEFSEDSDPKKQLGAKLEGELVKAQSKEDVANKDEGNFEIPTGSFLQTIGSNALVGLVGAALCAFGIPSSSGDGASRQVSANEAPGHQGWSLEQDDLFFRPHNS